MLCRETSVIPSKQKISKVEKIKILYAKLEKIVELEDTPSNESEFKEIVSYFKNFFESKKNKKSVFRWLFKDNVINGTINEEHRDNNPLQESKYDHQAEKDINGDSLLLRVMSIPSEDGGKKRDSLDTIKTTLIENCKEMIVFPKRNGKCKGMTPLHVAILKNDTQLLEFMAKTLGKSKKDMVQGICAVGPAFQKTAMMAGTLLGVATLKFNREIFGLVLKNFSSGLHETNEKGDNIIHSLIKYAHVQPDEKKDALTMLQYILSCNTKKEICKLLRMKNKEKLTPLQVSAKRQQYDFFQVIMQHEIYRSKQIDYGLYSEDVYDITEIESIAIKKDANTTDDDHIKDEIHESVLEYIVHHQTGNAFLFVNFLPVREVVKEKWRHYRWWLWVWLAIHFIFMILLSVAALYRSQLSESASNPEKKIFKYLVLENSFVTVSSVFSVVFGLIHLYIEIASLCFNRFQYKTSLNLLKCVRNRIRAPHSNFMFRFYFALFYLLLLVDIIVVVVVQDSFLEYNNICLIFAVIIGWYLFLFFLQGFKVLSFFTVLIQRVILDMLKFAFVMLIFLVGFSVAMFMIMQGADTEEDDFNHFGKTIVKMLTIMLGIGDLGILFQARQPILAISVFVLFVCLTTILLLNALIALMSNSCTELMSNGMVATKLHCRLQRLSLILFLESFFPLSRCKEVGFIEKTSMFGNNEMIKTNRRFWSLNSVQEPLEDEIDESLGDRGRKRKHKKRKNKSNAKMINRSAQTDLHQGIEKTLDITDIN